MPESHQTEVEFLAALRESEFWKYLQGYLMRRRDLLFLSDDAQTNEQMWKDKGAIRELTQLLNLPNLVMTKLSLEAERRREAAMQTERHLEDYDG